MASFNKLTIGNQTFDVSGIIQKLDARWIKNNQWYVRIPPKSQVDYQVGQIYQIDFDEMNDALEGDYPNYYCWGIETYVVSEIIIPEVVNNNQSGLIRFKQLRTGNIITFDGHVNAGVIEYFTCYEKYFLPSVTTFMDTRYMTPIEIDQVSYYSISEDIIDQYKIGSDGILFILGDTNVKCFANFSNGEDLYFINLVTYNQIPYERDDNEYRYLIKVSDVDASNSVSEGSSSVPVIATEYQSGDTRSITTTNKNEYEILSSEAPDVTSTILVSDENSDYKFINDSYFNYQTNMPVDNTYPSYVKAEFVGNFTFSVGGGK